MQIRIAKGETLGKSIECDEGIVLTHGGVEYEITGEGGLAIGRADGKSINFQKFEGVLGTNSTLIR